MIINKTAKYLSGSLNLIDRGLTFVGMKLLGFYVGHKSYPGEFGYDRHLFILVDLKESPDWQEKHADISQSNDFVSSYQVGSTEEFWCIYIMKLPETLKSDVMKLFFQGRYSEIYTDEQLARCIPTNSEAFDVITKNEKAQEKLAILLDMEIGKVLEVCDELDSSPNIHEEIYLYEEQEKLEMTAVATDGHFPMA